MELLLDHAHFLYVVLALGYDGWMDGRYAMLMPFSFLSVSRYPVVACFSLTTCKRMMPTFR